MESALEGNPGERTAMAGADPWGASAAPADRGWNGVGGRVWGKAGSARGAGEEGRGGVSAVALGSRRPGSEQPRDKGNYCCCSSVPAEGMWGRLGGAR
jgi:hypothetical protein